MVLNGRNSRGSHPGARRSNSGRGRVGWRRGVTLSLIAVVGLLVAPLSQPSSAAPGPPKYQLIAYTTIGASGASVVGHAFVDLKDLRTNTHLIFGKYPSTNNYFETPGLISDDGAKVWSWRISFDLTTKEFIDVGQFIKGERAVPSTYKLASSNCMAWVAEIAQIAGKTLPPLKDWAGIPSPAIFRDALQKAGNGATLNGGTVKQNTTGSTASGAPDPAGSPPCCDGPGILQAAMTDPTGLAQQLQLKLTDRVLAPDHVNADGSYVVEVTHTDPRMSLYGVAWGDGTTTFGHRPTSQGSTIRFTHRYQGPPPQPVRVFVLDNAQVTEFDRVLQAPDGHGHKEVDLEPPAGPVHAYG